MNNKLLLSPIPSIIYRGHSVTTVRFFDPTSPWMASMGENHTDVVLHLNNSDGRLPLVTREAGIPFLNHIGNIF